MRQITSIILEMDRMNSKRDVYEMIMFDPSYEIYFNETIDSYRSIKNLRSYEKFHDNNKVPQNKLGHYFGIEDRYKYDLIVPYHNFYGLNPPLRKDRKIVEYKEIDRKYVNWLTINWTCIDPFNGPPIKDPVWPEKGGKWRMDLNGFYIIFPSGLRFVPREMIYSLKRNNARLKETPPFSKKECEKGEWVINRFNVWEIQLKNGEKYMPL